MQARCFPAKQISLIFTPQVKHMKIGQTVLSFFVALMVLSTTAKAQSKAKPTAKPAAPANKTIRQDTPPPMEPMQLSDMITFDTTAVADDAFSADIRQLMNAMQFKENLIKTVAGALDQNATQLPAEYREPFKQKFMQELTQGPGMRWMENMFIKNYRRVFTQAEIEELIAFYQTSLGKKFIDKSPELTINIMQDSQKIGEYIGFKVGKELSNPKAKM